MKANLNLLAVAALALGTVPGHGQSALLSPVQKQAPLNESGQVMIAGHSTPFVIRHLPASSFPQLPSNIVELLNHRGCTIPQTYEAHHPENVIHANFAQAGSSDWAVLCSVKGTVSLLVFFDGGAGQTEPIVLASSPETERLQTHDASGVLGFNWGIDPATPQQVHEAQSNMKHRPALVDHDALADSTIEQHTIYHFYANSNWSLLETAD
jgi:hypothetical protein